MANFETSGDNPNNYVSGPHDYIPDDTEFDLSQGAYNSDADVVSDEPDGYNDTGIVSQEMSLAPIVFDMEKSAGDPAELAAKIGGVQDDASQRIQTIRPGLLHIEEPGNLFNDGGKE
jgi:hypothetical protein